MTVLVSSLDGISTTISQWKTFIPSSARLQRTWWLSTTLVSRTRLLLRMAWTINLAGHIPCSAWLSSRLMRRIQTTLSQVSYKWWIWQAARDRLSLEIKLTRSLLILTRVSLLCVRSLQLWQTPKKASQLLTFHIESPSWLPFWDIPSAGIAIAWWLPVWIRVIYMSKRT